MPLYISDDALPLQLPFLGNIFSAIAYGIVIILSGNCFHLLLKNWGLYSNRMPIILLIYITTMLFLSTLSLIQSICEFMQITTKRNLLPVHLPDATLPFIVWGADGFMVRISILCQEQTFTMQLHTWRCLVLYQNISRGPRVVIIVLLSLISFASVGRSISIYIPGSHSNCH